MIDEKRIGVRGAVEAAEKLRLSWRRGGGCRLSRYMRTKLLPAIFLSSLTLPAVAAQESLQPVINNSGENVLQFDWPILRIGTGEYKEGPTGVTVFHFNRKVLGAVDVRGGAPGTVNAEYLKLGYDLPELDAVVFAGGSWYGLEAATAVATALKDDGIRDGSAFSDVPNIALSVGSIIYDFGARRLNEIYPDKRLAQAAFRAAKPGIFPLGAYGAGRFARTGYFFGCGAYSGQGGAYREIGEVKIAAFTVVNAIGVVTDREGKVAACYQDPAWPKGLNIKELTARFLADKTRQLNQGKEGRANNRNTTVSLVITNQKLSPAELQRLAVQVHTSMGRGLQPFATQNDGDVLYAVSTAELEQPLMSSAELGVAASDVMWDAILNSVPPQPGIKTASPKINIKRSALRAMAGRYRFSDQVSLEVTHQGNKLFARATGLRDVYAIGRKDRVALQPLSEREFTVPGRYPLTLRFASDGRLVINPGHWEQTGVREGQ